MRRMLLALSTVMTVLQGLVWLAALMYAHKEQSSSMSGSLRLFWLPLLPAALAAICWEVLRWQRSTSTMLHTLRQSMYRHKNA